MSYPSPAAHLFEQLGMDGRESTSPLGKGAVIVRKASPAALASEANGSTVVLDLARAACRSASLKWKMTGSLILRRGPYVIVAGLDEAPEAVTKTLTGRFVDLFDAKLPVLREVPITPGSRHLLIDLDRQKISGPHIIASASKLLNVRVDGNQLRFHAEGPQGVITATRVALPAPPQRVKAGAYTDAQVTVTWDAASRTALLEFPDAPEGVEVEVSF